MRGFFIVRNLLEKTTFKSTETQSSSRARPSHAWIIWAKGSKNSFYVHNGLDTLDMDREGDHESIYYECKTIPITLLKTQTSSLYNIKL